MSHASYLKLLTFNKQALCFYHAFLGFVVVFLREIVSIDFIVDQSGVI